MSKRHSERGAGYSSWSTNRSIGRKLRKKGMDDKLMFIIWELIAIAVVVLILVVAVRGIANSTTYWKKYHSADLATMTDVMLTNQGDFNINYNLKELRKNWFTKLLKVDELRFQIFMKDGAYSVYEGSSSDDRYPQSFVFAKDKDIEILPADTSSDYLTLKKTGNTFSIESSNIIISCPSVDTKKDISTLRFDVMSLDPKFDDVKDYIESALSIDLGNNAETKEALILLSPMNNKNSDADAILYYNKDSSQKSEKMACLIRKRLYDNELKIIIIEKEYDNTKESSKEFVDKRSEYNQWVMIKYNTEDIDKSILASGISKALKEYYG